MKLYCTVLLMSISSYQGLNFRAVTSPKPPCDRKWWRDLPFEVHSESVSCLRLSSMGKEWDEVLNHKEIWKAKLSRWPRRQFQLGLLGSSVDKVLQSSSKFRHRCLLGLYIQKWTVIGHRSLHERLLPLWMVSSVLTQFGMRGLTNIPLSEGWSVNGSKQA